MTMVMDRDDSASASIEIAPLQYRGAFGGFMIIGRWPRDTVEWSKMLVRAVQLAAVPGLLPHSTVFCVEEKVPDDPTLRAVGRATKAGHFVGADPLRPGVFADPLPPALVVLHPPASTLSSVPDYAVASGCVLLPGLPHLGLDFRAAWVAADARGTVTELHSRCGINPDSDADTAALAMLMAA